MLRPQNPRNAQKINGCVGVLVRSFALGWLDARWGRQSSLALVGVDATTVVVDLAAFLKWPAFESSPLACRCERRRVFVRAATLPPAWASGHSSVVGL
jgi:hypothetical protein